jgi:hypothetical protein
MSYGGRGSLDVAIKNMVADAKKAAADPNRGRQSNPGSYRRPDLRRDWDRAYMKESARLAYLHGV